MEYYQQLGEKIRVYRKQRGLTQAQLGDATGYTPTHIGSLENAKTTPSLEAVIRIANVLGVTLDQLLIDYLNTPEIVYLNGMEKRLKAMPIKSRILACDMLEKMMDLIEAVDSK